MQWDVCCHRAQSTEIFLSQLTGKTFLAINIEGKVYKGKKCACSNLTAQGCFPSPRWSRGLTGDMLSGCVPGSGHDSAKPQIPDVFRTLMWL